MRGLSLITGAALCGATLAFANDQETTMQTHPYIGMWITADGHIRQ